MKLWKKGIGLLLALCLVLGALPMAALAAEPVPTGYPFTDVPEDAWYRTAVKYAYENGLMNGTGENRFTPDGTTTCGMVVTILYQLSGSPVIHMTPPPEPNGKFYQMAMIWGDIYGIADPFGDQAMDPEAAITREQMAVVLYRYASLNDYDLTPAGGLSAFVDKDEISPWAKEALTWAVGAGLFSGSEDHKLMPGGGAVRSQTATLLMLFLQTVSMAYGPEQVQDGTVFYDVAAAAASFRRMALTWPHEITLKVDQNVMDDLSRTSRESLAQALRWNCVVLPGRANYDLLWLYNLEGNEFLGATDSLGQEYYIVTYTCSLNREEIRETIAAADQLIEELHLKNGTDFEAVKALYDWFTTEVQYDHDENAPYNKSSTPYGPLIEKKGVCAGIGMAMCQVLNRLDIPCRYVTGYASDGDRNRHGWNFVLLDGQYYGLDATLDLGDIRYEWFLTGADTFLANGTRHVPAYLYGEEAFQSQFPLADQDYLTPGTAGYEYAQWKEAFSRFTVECNEENVALLQWSKVPGATSYTIEWKSPNGDWARASETQSTATAIKVENAGDGEFGWRIRTDNGAHSEELYLGVKEIGKKTGSTYPSVPYITYCASEAKGSVSLRWVTGKDTQKCVVYMRSQQDSTYKIAYDGPLSGITIQSLTPGQSYTFVVVAVGDNGVRTTQEDCVPATVTVQ